MLPRWGETRSTGFEFWRRRTLDPGLIPGRVFNLGRSQSRGRPRPAPAWRVQNGDGWRRFPRRARTTRNTATISARLHGFAPSAMARARSNDVRS